MARNGNYKHKFDAADLLYLFNKNPPPEMAEGPYPFQGNLLSGNTAGLPAGILF